MCSLALEEVEAQGRAAMRGVPSLLGVVERQVRQPNPSELGVLGCQGFRASAMKTPSGGLRDLVFAIIGKGADRRAGSGAVLVIFSPTSSVSAAN